MGERERGEYWEEETAKVRALEVGRSLETSRIRMLVQSGRKGEARVARTCSSLRTWSLPGERGGATREPLPAKGRQDRVGYEKNTIIE